MRAVGTRAGRAGRWLLCLVLLLSLLPLGSFGPLRGEGNGAAGNEARMAAPGVPALEQSQRLTLAPLMSRKTFALALVALLLLAPATRPFGPRPKPRPAGWRQPALYGQLQLEGG